MENNAVKYMKATGSLKASRAYEKERQRQETMLFIVLLTIVATISVFSVLIYKGIIRI